MLTKKFQAIFLVCLFVFLYCLLSMPAKAADFDPNYLISDAEMVNHNSMDLADIQRFLEKRSGTLKSYVTLDKENNLKTATQTFFEVAKRWLINPKYLLVLVQKEQSLLEDNSPSQGQYDRATGYGCPDSGGCDDRWKGFYRQVNSAAAQTRYYMDNINEFSYQPGRTYNIDGQSVTPKNIATAGLYNYTPHLHGNQSFWNLWNQYFGKKWPDGSLLQVTDSDKIFLIQNGEKREIASKAVFASRFDAKKIITVSQEDLDAYDSGVPLKYINFSLLKDNGSSSIYMIVDDQKRKIESQEIFKSLGLPDDEIIPVDSSELTLYKDGPEITKYTLYPAGTLMQDSKTKEIFYILSSKKRLIVNKEILDYNFHGLAIKKVSTADLDIYRLGNPVTLPDGELVKIKGVNTVYVISQGRRLPIYNSKIFEKMSYKWSNVKTVSKQTLELHELGQTITGDW